MTQVRCTVALPPDAPTATAGRVLVEVRDVSLADAPSTVVGSAELHDVALSPGTRLPPVAVEVEEGERGRTLVARVHVDLTGSGTVTPGDLLTTSAVPVDDRSPTGAVDVPVTVV